MEQSAYLAVLGAIVNVLAAPASLKLLDNLATDSAEWRRSCRNWLLHGFEVLEDKWLTEVLGRVQRHDRWGITEDY